MGRFSGFKSSNKKVKNATKTTVDGIKFDSKLEAFMYSLLKMHRFEFSMKEKIILQEKFKYGSESIREIAMFPDFTLTINGTFVVLETKGSPNDVYPLKAKLLKHWLTKNHPKSMMFVPSTKQECEKVINLLLKGL